MAITAEQINFDANSTPVVSGAQKFVLPIPKLKDGEPLIHSEGAQAGQPITDWQGNPIGDKGVVFVNDKDGATQAVKGDGNGVVIINLVTEEQAAKLTAKINEFNSDPTQLSLDEIKKVLQYARETCGLTDMYNSDKDFISSKMSAVGAGTGVGVPAYGLYKRDDHDICHAVFVPGSGEFQGPAATSQKFSNGVVILQQQGQDGISVRAIQPDAFEASYRHADGRPIAVSELAVATVISPPFTGTPKL